MRQKTPYGRMFPIAALPEDSAPRVHGGEMSRSAHGRGIAIIRRSE